MDAGFFKGTSAEQDVRFSDKEKKLLKTLKFPPELDKKVDMRKVELSTIRKWIAKRVTELLGFEDEIVIEYVNGLLETDKINTFVDPKRMQLNLTAFLSENTGQFMTQLWRLLLSAQDSPSGIPQEFIEEKKEEMRKRKEAEEAEKQKKQAEIKRLEELDAIRQREKQDRHNRRPSSGSKRDDVGDDKYRRSNREEHRDRERRERDRPREHRSRRDDSLDRDRRASRDDRNRSPPARRYRSRSISTSPERDHRHRHRRHRSPHSSGHRKRSSYDHSSRSPRRRGSDDDSRERSHRRSYRRSTSP